MTHATLHGVPEPYAQLLRVRNLECAELRRQNERLREEVRLLTAKLAVVANPPFAFLPSQPPTPNPQPQEARP